MENKYIDKSFSWSMFDRIAHSYDFLNRSLSLGIDKYWRRKVIKYLPQRNNLIGLDLATGTADLLILLAKQNNIQEVVGIDLSKEMLSIGQKKINKATLKANTKLMMDDIQRLSFKNNHFDFATVSFGIRNIPDTVKGLKEVYRVLAKEGVFIILELTTPSNYILQKIYLTYFRFILPFIGGLISGDKKAYSYLNQTVESFPQKEDFCALLKEAKFNNISYKTLTGGIATLYIAYKK